MGFVYLQLSFKKEYFQGIIASWGSRGVQLYLKYIWLDFVYLISYTLLLSSAYAYFTCKLKGEKIHSLILLEKLVFICPFVAAFCDVCENIFHILILSKRLFAEDLIFTSSIFSLIKWFFLIFGAIGFMRRYFEFRNYQRSSYR